MRRLLRFHERLPHCHGGYRVRHRRRCLPGLHDHRSDVPGRVLSRLGIVLGRGGLWWLVGGRFGQPEFKRRMSLRHPVLRGFVRGTRRVLVRRPRRVVLERWAQWGLRVLIGPSDGFGLRLHGWRSGWGAQAEGWRIGLSPERSVGAGSSSAIAGAEQVGPWSCTRGAATKSLARSPPTTTRERPPMFWSRRAALSAPS